MCSIEVSVTGRVNLDGPEMQEIRRRFDRAVGEIIEGHIMSILAGVDFAEIEARVIAQNGIIAMEEKQPPLITQSLVEMMTEEVRLSSRRSGYQPKTKPPERNRWVDTDPGRAKAKAARKQNKKRRQK